MEKTAIRETDNDAAIARISAVNKGYLTDPFISHFVNHPQSRPPLINIGTYLRSEAIDKLVHQWLTAGSGVKKQIVSLGAGSDTRFWRLSDSLLKHSIAHYIEIDFRLVTLHKAAQIVESEKLSETLGPDFKLEMGGSAIMSPTYTLFPQDLGELLHLQSLISSEILSPDLPTLFIAECVFPYMSLEQTDRVLKWFSDNFKILGGVVYEMFGLTDKFGMVMRENLKSRHITLPGVDAYPTLQEHRNRFLSRSYQTANAVTLKNIRRSYTSKEETYRINRLEMLDEVEELDLVLDHYVVSWGAKFSSDVVSPEYEEELSKWGLHSVP